MNTLFYIENSDKNFYVSVFFLLIFLLESLLFLIPDFLNQLPDLLVLAFITQWIVTLVIGIFIYDEALSEVRVKQISGRKR